jgi:hypothetical protein
VFSQPRVKQLLTQYTLVQLYTDTVPPEFQQFGTAEQNRRLQQERFQTAQLPLYVILEPQPGGDFKEVDRYIEGKINNVEAFVGFLREGLERTRASNTRAQVRRD